jgi:4-amino-4-deoxy-L-arabinose transferase-like glycosyltransferase
MVEKIKNWLNSGDNFLYALFGVSLFLRLVYALALPIDKLSPDAQSWMELGQQIALGQGFGGSWRPPGYAFFLGAVFFIFGKSVLAARIIQTILAAFTCVFSYKTARHLFNEETGRITGTLAAFYPYFIAYSADLISETLLTFMLAAAVLGIVRTSREPNWKNMALTGLLIGLTALTKSTTLPFFLLACAWLWWQTGKLRTGLMVGVLTLMTIAPWTFRNYFHYDKSYIMPVSTPWYTLYGATSDEALYGEMRGDTDVPSTDEARSLLNPKDWDYISSLPLQERDKICKEKALTWIKENPYKFLHLIRLRFVHFWRLYPMMAYKWQKYAAMATSGVYIPLCFLGIILSIREFKKTSLLLALFATYTAVHLVFFSMIRYRVPIDTFIMIFAAYAIQAGYKRLLRPA